LCFVCFLFVVICLSVPVQLILERLVSEITYYVSSGTLNPTQSLTLVCSFSVIVRKHTQTHSPTVGTENKTPLRRFTGALCSKRLLNSDKESVFTCSLHTGIRKKHERCSRTHHFTRFPIRLIRPTVRSLSLFAMTIHRMQNAAYCGMMTRIMMNNRVAE